MKDNKNLSELEVFNIAFDETLGVLEKGGAAKKALDTLTTVKNYYINKIVRKTSMQTAHEAALQELDAGLHAARLENNEQ